MREEVADDSLLGVFTDMQEPLRVMLLGRLGVEEDVHDVMQETFLRMASGTARTSIGNPRGYLWRIASNLATDSIREASRSRLVFASDDQAIERTQNGLPTPEQDAERRSCAREMRRIFRGLPPNCRRAFLLSRRDGMSYGEIADVLGVSPNMVKKHITRALGSLRIVTAQ